VSVYQVTLTTVASITLNVVASSEEEAIDVAYPLAHEVADEYIHVRNGSLDLNREWQLEEPHARLINKNTI